MKSGKKFLSFLTAAFLSLSLAGCGSSAKPAQDGEESGNETIQTETEEPVQKPAEYLVPAEEAEPGHFSDPAAFAGFDEYTGKYMGYKDDYSDEPVILGETVLKDHYTGTIANRTQYEDASHEKVVYAETLEPGAIGIAGLSWYSSRFSNSAFIVYNPSDQPAAFEDCVIIGFEDDPAEMTVFENGLNFAISRDYGFSMQKDPCDDIAAILGEPYKAVQEYEYNGFTTVRYTWRDESGRHILETLINHWEDNYSVSALIYKNFAAAGK